MLEHVPLWLGYLLRNVRADHDRLAIAHSDLLIPERHLDLSSPAFGSGARLPERFTADGEGISPPLIWSEAPEETRSFLLMVEDADAPAPHPLVHAIVLNIDPSERALTEGALSGDFAKASMGRNSY